MCATAAAAYVWAYLFILSSNLLKDKLKYSKIWKSLFEQIFTQIGQHQLKWLGALYKQELCTKAFIEHAAAAAAKSLQSCPTLCDPIAAQQAPRPWDSPGKNTGVGCHFLLQYMKVKSESEVPQSCIHGGKARKLFDML